MDVTKVARMRNKRIRWTTKVGEISKRVQERRLKLYGHVMRREEEYVGGGGRRKGRPKRRWMDSVNVDLREKELSGEEMQRPGCVETTCEIHLPHIEVGKDAVKVEDDKITHLGM